MIKRVKFSLVFLTVFFGIIVNLTNFSIPEAQALNCSNGWYVTGYFTPKESDYSGPLKQITVNGKSYSFKSSFIDKVKIEGWGKTINYNYLGYYSNSFHFGAAPVDSNGNVLVTSVIATDKSVIPHGTSVLIPTLPVPWNTMQFIANDIGTGVSGKHIDVYTGEGLAAEQETYKITGSNNNVCVGFDPGQNPSCSLLDYGDWLITSSCTIISNVTAPANIIVQNNSKLTVPSGVTLDINFANSYILIKSGSKVVIEYGGKII